MLFSQIVNDIGIKIDGVICRIRIRIEGNMFTDISNKETMCCASIATTTNITAKLAII